MQIRKNAEDFICWRDSLMPLAQKIEVACGIELQI
jgi:hypothetical protein